MNKGIYVFTTRKVMIEKKPILKIVCDEDGDWQFFAKNDLPTSQNALLVSLDEILQMDKNLETIISQCPLGNLHIEKMSYPHGKLKICNK
jgi:hypothetical protein